jgi:hypothetical protein
MPALHGQFTNLKYYVLQIYLDNLYYKILFSHYPHKDELFSHNLITISPSAEIASALANAGLSLHRVRGVLGAGERGCHAELLEPDGLYECIGKTTDNSEKTHAK